MEKDNGTMETQQITSISDRHDMLLATLSGSKKTSSEVSALVLAEMAALPAERRQAFERAWAHSTSLVMTESNPELFYHTENGHSHAAAARLARYWTMRADVLGHRAFLPLLDMTGKAALTVQDIELWQTGVFAPYFFDKKRRTVIVMDLTRIDASLASAFRERRQQLQLWMFTYAAVHNPRCQDEGVRLLEVVESVSGIDQNTVHDWLGALPLEAMPLKLLDVHFVATSAAAEGAVESTTFDVFTVISARDLVHTRMALQESGFYVESLPMAIGGLWMYEEFRDWFVRRVETPWSEIQVVLPSDLAVLYDISLRIYPPNTVEQIHAVLTAIQGLPADDQVELLEAVLLVPYLVATETNPSLFWRVEGGDAVAAAHRLAGNWKMRKTFFGARYLRPLLDLTGEGALSEDDVAIIASGLYVNNVVDNQGRIVGVADFKRVPSSLAKHFTEARTRLGFWAYSQAALFSPSVQYEGGRYLRILEVEPIMNRALLHFRRGMSMAIVTPIKLIEMIFIAVPPPGARTMCEQTILPLIQSAIDQGSDNVKEQTECYDKINVLMVDDPDKAREELLQRGYLANQLPKILGGTWSYDNFTAWIDRQKQVTRQQLAEMQAPRPDSVRLSVPPGMDDEQVETPLPRVVYKCYRDYSQIPVPERLSVGSSTIGDDQHSFATKLHLILSDQNLTRFISWQYHGRAFKVCDYGLLEDSKILYKYFGIRRAAVFIQHLLSHGFKRISQGEDRGCFYHECMLRGLPHVAKYMSHAHNPHAQVPDPANEPPLAQISKQYPLAATAIGTQPQRLRRKARRRYQQQDHPHGAVVVQEIVGKDCHVVNHTYRDYSRVPIPDDYEGEKEDIHAMSFPEKLHHILSQPIGYHGLMWWLPHGRAFRLGNVERLENSNLLYHYFGIHRVSILILHLQCHGFKRLTVGPDRGSFYHDCMLRGLPHLTRYVGPPRDSRILVPDPRNEPCLTTISREFPLPDHYVTS